MLFIIYNQNFLAFFILIPGYLTCTAYCGKRKAIKENDKFLRSKDWPVVTLYGTRKFSRQWLFG